MYDLKRVFLECIGEMRKAGIPVQNGKVFEIKEGNIEGFLGLYNDYGCYNFSIIIREDLLQDTCPLKELKEVIIQGVFHTCPRCLSHGEKWRKYAQMMNETYGYSFLEGKDDESIFHREKPVPQRYVCRNCGDMFDSKENHHCRCVFCNKWMLSLIHI